MLWLRGYSFVGSSDLATCSGLVLKASEKRKDLSGLVDSSTSNMCKRLNLTGLSPALKNLELSSFHKFMSELKTSNKNLT